jgi:hypothetical protein
VARAEAGAATGAEYSSAAPLVERAHTIAELEAGFIALPTAAISQGQQGGNVPILGQVGRGDATPMTGIHLMYRGGRDWEIGAGALFGPKPSADDKYGVGAIQRTHSRSYFTVGAEGRYVPLHFRSIEVWVGLTAGGVIVADRFTTATEAVPQILGSPTVTVRTEGFALGVETGLNWLFAERWVAGFAVRADRWILPSSPQCTPIRDCATLTGSVAAFEVGLQIGYRIPL